MSVPAIVRMMPQTQITVSARATIQTNTLEWMSSSSRYKQWLQEGCPVNADHTQGQTRRLNVLCVVVRQIRTAIEDCLQKYGIVHPLGSVWWRHYYLPYVLTLQLVIWHRISIGLSLRIPQYFKEPSNGLIVSQSIYSRTKNSTFQILV